MINMICKNDKLTPNSVSIFLVQFSENIKWNLKYSIAMKICWTYEI